MSTLYERLGGAENIARISDDIVERHKINPIIKARFADVEDEAAFKRRVAQFFSMGSGGPTEYDGRTMPDAHRNMNINEIELVAAIDDVLAACKAHDVDDTTCNDVLAILYSLKGDVLAQ